MFSAPIARRRRFRPMLDTLSLRLAPSTCPMDPLIGDPPSPPAEITPMDPTVSDGGSYFQPQTPATT